VKRATPFVVALGIVLLATLLAGTLFRLLPDRERRTPGGPAIPPDAGTPQAGRVPDRERRTPGRPAIPPDAGTPQAGRVPDRERRTPGRPAIPPDAAAGTHAGGPQTGRVLFTWLGNSGGVGTAHVPTYLHGMAVGPDGTCYTNAVGDEGKNNISAWKNGVFRSSAGGHGVAFGLYLGGQAVAVTPTYTFFSMNVINQTIGAADPTRFTVGFQRHRGGPAGLGGPLPFDQAQRTAGNPPAYYAVDAFLQNSFPNIGNGITAADLQGIAVKVTRASPERGTIYVSSPASGGTGKIISYSYTDADIGPAKASVGFANPGPLIIDKNGLLWVIKKSGSPYAISTVSPDLLTVTNNKIRLAPGSNPVALGYDSVNHRLLVCDSGTSFMQVKVYDLSADLSANPSPVLDTYGVAGGVYAAPTAGKLSAVWPPRLAFPAGVGMDSSGNLYVMDQGVAISPSAAPQFSRITGWGPAPVGQPRTRLWEVTCTNDVICDLDPDDETAVYGAQNFKGTADWSKTTPGTEWTAAGVIYHTTAYPTASTFGGTTPWARRIVGRGGVRKLFLFTADQNGSVLTCFRALSGGTVMAPAAQLAAAGGGTGLAVNVTTRGGAIRTAAVAAGGTGYPAGATFARQVNAGNGDGFVLCTSNASGVVRAVSVLKPGSGYTTADGVATQDCIQLSRDTAGDGTLVVTDACVMQGGLNVKYVDDRGDIYLVWWGAGTKAFTRFPCTGLDAHGVPTYGPPKVYGQPAPNAGFSPTRLVCLSASKELYLTGFTGGYVSGEGSKDAGDTLWKYRWDGSTDTGGQTPVWAVKLPSRTTGPGDFRYPNSLDVAGDYVFVGFAVNSAAARGVLTDGPEVRAYRRSDGTFVKSFVLPNPIGFPWLLDCITSMRARRRANGEYLIFVEDNIGGSCSRVIRWSP
jgi:hypothetical protein